jgi:WD40 repeat protein
MSLLFVSHSSEDDASASHVSSWLAEQGFQSLFLDFDPEQGIPAGRNWERELYARLRQADAVVFLDSPASQRSAWCFAELVLARAWGVPVFPVRVGRAAGHELVADLQRVELDDDGLERLATSLRLHGLDPATAFAWDPTRTPYPGLRSFDADDAAVFFGRDEEIGELLERLRPSLRRRSASLALVGPSGSGKSSLVHAGLLPRLRRMPAEWVVLPPLFPGDRPVEALARSLAEPGIEQRLRSEPGALGELARDIAGDRQLVLLFVDQAEELVTLASDDAREEFVRVIGSAVEGPGPLRVLFTLRSEFLSGLLQQPGTAALMRDWMALAPLDRARLPAVVSGPARRAGVVFDDGLVERIVEDAQGGDALPLLAYTLRQLHERAGGGMITAAIYEARGGVLGALRGQADRVLEDLDLRGLGALVMPTLLKLVTLGAGDEPTRRRLSRTQLAPAENEVVDAFIDVNLVVSDRVEDEPVVAVAHEALLRSWPPLAAAITGARDDLRERAQLERMALDWERAGRQPAYTLAGARLHAAQAWVQTHPDAPARVHELIAASVASDASARRRAGEALARRAAEAEPEFGAQLAVAAIEEHGPIPALVDALREALQRSRVRAVLRGGDSPVTSAAWAPDGVSAATGAVDGTVRVWNTITGQLVREIAGEDPVTDVAFSPDGAELAIRTGPGRARVVQVAERILERPAGMVNGADGAIDWSTSDGSGVDLRAGTVSPDGGRILSVSPWPTRASVHVLDGEELLDLTKGAGFYTHHARPDVYASSAAWSADGRLIGAALEDSGWVWDANDGHLVAKLLPDGPVAAPPGRRAITSISFSADGSRVVTVFRDGVARVWDAGGGRELLTLGGHGEIVTRAAFSPRGTRVLTASDDGAARVFEVGDGHAAQPSVSGFLYEWPGQAPLSSVAFSPDGTQVVAGATDGTVHLWEAGAGKLAVLHGHEDEVTSVGFAPDASLIVSASLDGTLRFWPVAGGEPRTITGPNPGGHFAAAGARFTSVAYSADGTRVVAGQRDSSARIWDVTSGGELVGVRQNGPVTDVAFAPDGTRIATSSWDEMFAAGMMGQATACIWSAESPQRLHSLSHRARVLCVEFSSDSARLATGSEDASARIWDAGSGEELRAIREHRGPVTSVAFSPDGGRLLTASEDATARVWDLVDGRERFVFAGHGGPVTCAAFASDGSRIATASADGTVRVWQETGAEELLRTAHRRLPERLSADARQRFGLPETDGPPCVRVADLPSFEDADRDALIAERARSIAAAPDAGSDEENWVRAERELRAEGRLG